MASTNSRPVHPCILNVWEGSPGGAEYSTWAYLDPHHPRVNATSTPHLVTSQNSTLTVYAIEEETSKLIVKHKFANLAGSVCYLATLHSSHGADALLIGFAGYPRLSIVNVTSQLLRAVSLMDLTHALKDACYGATSPMEQDLQASLSQRSNGRATLLVILGGGITVACLELTQHKEDWVSSEPYLLPLQSLRPMPQHADTVEPAATSTATASSIVTGFGDILSASFLPGYSEPTAVLLHCNSAGQTCSGRLGREEGGTRNGMVVTAVTVTVAHSRSAVLWSTEVPADALQVYSSSSHDTNGGCLVHCVNTIVAISNTGQIQQILATNGWAPTALPLSLQGQIAPNPWPFPALSVALDGAEFSFVNAHTAFCVLRNGQVYLLQHTNTWSLLPLFTTIGTLGQVANVISLPLGSIQSSSLITKFLNDKMMKTGTDDKLMELGLLFVGSRLGDSSLLGYGLLQSSIEEAMKKEPGVFKTKKEEHTEKVYDAGDEEYERILRMEEEALYAQEEGDAAPAPDIVPPSDDDEEVVMMGKRKRAKLSQLTVVQSLTVLDSVTALGPLGPGCLGPVSQGHSSPSDSEELLNGKPPQLALGSTGYIYPCGYGSSGGVAILTVPGRDDRTILAEEDCINAKAIFSLPSRGLVLLSMADRIRFMKVESTSVGQSMEEIDMTTYTSKELRDLFKGCELLAACERNDASFCLLIAIKIDEKNISYSVLVVEDRDGNLKVETNIPLTVPEGESIRSVAPMIRRENQVVLCYTVSTGNAKVVTLEDNGDVRGFGFEAQLPMDKDMNGGDNSISAEEKFYKWGTISAIDAFRAPKAFFRGSTSGSARAGEEKSSGESSESSSKKENDFDLEEEDRALYGETKESESKDVEMTEGSNSPIVDLEEQEWFVAIVRQSGALELYSSDEKSQNSNAEPIWACQKCSHGVPILSPNPQTGPAYRIPKHHQVQTGEIRFFFCGPSKTKSEPMNMGPRAFCLAIETSDGDTMLYRANLHPVRFFVESFDRVLLKLPGRPSKEQGKHFMKLRRKGIVKQKGGEIVGGFRHNNLFRFENLSHLDGLFAATTRPMWFIAERGQPTFLDHRCRHVAPAGAKPKPVAGFCSGILSGEPGFMTLHERVGRVGSQRLTAFSGILDFTNTHGIVPGGGYFVERLSMGVSVRSIHFIENPAVCGSRPLYALLVSREYEEDQSALNDDGLTEEERVRIAEEKENAKIQRQVEADLGGFDMEQEWVEEIERDDCFKIEKKLGGTPPIPKSAYSVWIVDAANGWVVVDSYELEEFEHGLTMQVMSLSVFLAEPGSNVDVSEDDLDTRQFITVGTGFVGKDGEDVSSKGRVILLELTKPVVSSSGVELNFVYEKNIFHGPVNSLSCLSSEGKNRLIIGAGADVNVEQWGNDKLTQVGFFRATMHILDIKLFKNFFLLSDAYDSLHFLVWRESDKSLTLLAKDYDPIAVYAAGLLSRGGSLDMVCHDDRQNLQFFQYAPSDAAARGGNKLVCRADFHLGSQTTDLQSHFCRNSLLVSSATPTSTIAALQQQDGLFGRTDDDKRLGVHFGTIDGEYGAIIPLSEPVYWRLTALQTVMANALESDCALSPQAWRLYRRSPRRGGCRNNDRKKGVIDGNLVLRFADLALADQEDLSSAIGSTVDLILDNLLEIRCSAMVL